MKLYNCIRVCYELGFYYYFLCAPLSPLWLINKRFSPQRAQRNTEVQATQNSIEADSKVGF
jgi:hypothetical protein